TATSHDVRAVASGGNSGAIVATASATREEFQTLFIPAPTDGLNSQWGYSVDASTDLTGDGLADMVVGQRFNDRAYIYFGSATGYATTPDVVIIGPAASGFGFSVAVAGDITATSATSTNDVAAQDLVIAAAEDFTGASFFGRVYVVEGRDWTTSGTIDLSAS